MMLLVEGTALLVVVAGIRVKLISLLNGPTQNQTKVYGLLAIPLFHVSGNVTL